jgi:hypothetical protein
MILLPLYKSQGKCTENLRGSCFLHQKITFARASSDIIYEIASNTQPQGGQDEKKDALECPFFAASFGMCAFFAFARNQAP